MSSVERLQLHVGEELLHFIDILRFDVTSTGMRQYRSPNTEKDKDDEGKEERTCF